MAPGGVIVTISGTPSPSRSPMATPAAPAMVYVVPPLLGKRNVVNERITPLPSPETTRR